MTDDEREPFLDRLFRVAQVVLQVVGALVGIAGLYLTGGPAAVFAVAVTIAWKASPPLARAVAGALVLVAGWWWMRAAPEARRRVSAAVMSPLLSPPPAEQIAPDAEDF